MYMCNQITFFSDQKLYTKHPITIIKREEFYTTIVKTLMLI